MELVEYAQAVDHSRMPLLLRVLNALGWYAFLADIPLMAYAYCLVMARNGFPNLTMDEGRLVGASVLLPFAALGWITPVWAAVGMSISSLTVVLNALRLTWLPRGVGAPPATTALPAAPHAAQALPRS